MSNPPQMPNRKKSPITSKPDQRVSDTERQAVVEQLRLNTADGRLDVDEFGDRVEQALAARTGAELGMVLHDLPHLQSPEVAAEHRRKTVRAILIPYLATNVLLVLIWALTGMGYFWPIWVIVSWGFAVVMSIAKVAGSNGGPRGDGWRN